MKKSYERILGSEVHNDEQIGMNYFEQDNFFSLRLPVKSQVLDLIEMSVVHHLEFGTGMRTLIAWACQKAFWSMLNVLFTQSADRLTPALLREKMMEMIVFHLLFKLVKLQSPEKPNSLLGKNTKQKLASLSNPTFLCDVIKGIEWPEFDIEFVSKSKPSALTRMAGPIIHDLISKEKDQSEFHKKRSEVADDLLKLTTTMLKDLDTDDEGTSDTVANAVLWITSFMDSIKVPGNDSLTNAPMLANMGQLSHNMCVWFGWDRQLFLQIQRSNKDNRMAFSLNRMKNWIEKTDNAQALNYYQEMTGIKLDPKKLKKAASRGSNLQNHREIIEETEAEIRFDDSARFVLSATELNDFLQQEDRYKDQDLELEWDQHSMWTDVASTTMNSEPEDDEEMLAVSSEGLNLTSIQPPLTRNIADRLNVLQQVSNNLKCVAISTDNRPCVKPRAKNSMYCTCHQSLGSAFTDDIIKQIMNPELIQNRYHLIRGVRVKTPSTNPCILSRRMKASLDGPNWEFDCQIKVMEHLLRKLFEAGLRRTHEERSADVIPEAELIREFGKLKYTTYTQVYRSTREKLTLLGLDPSVRWTKYVPFCRLILGAHFGYMEPSAAMGQDEVEFLQRQWIPTHSKWSNSMEETTAWNKSAADIGIPVLNHQYNHGGVQTPVIYNNGVRKADMNATPLFR